MTELTFLFYFLVSNSSYNYVVKIYACICLATNTPVVAACHTLKRQPAQVTEEGTQVTGFQSFLFGIVLDVVLFVCTFFEYFVSELSSCPTHRLVYKQIYRCMIYTDVVHTLIGG